MDQKNSGPRPAPQITALRDELERGLAVVLSVDDLAYCRTSKGGSSAGAQFRHVLDHVRCLLRGLATGRIDYTNRRRDVRVEIDRDFAAETFGEVLEDLTVMDPRSLGRSVLVRSEVDENSWMPSGFARELEAALSHTIHHHALIAEKLLGLGIDCGGEFGMAPSTIAYKTKLAA